MKRFSEKVSFIWSVADLLRGDPKPSEAYISQHVAMCRPDNTLNRGLIAYMVGGTWGRAHYDLSMNGGTKAGPARDDMRNTPLAVLPTAEQDALSSRIDESFRLFEHSARRLNEQLTTLREYRQSLITAAVTGQLDIAGAA